MQNDGGNPQRKLDGDVTVSDVAGMEEDEVLGTEYNIAQERFSRMLRVKKGLGIAQARDRERSRSSPQSRDDSELHTRSEFGAFDHGASIRSHRRQARRPLRLCVPWPWPTMVVKKSRECRVVADSIRAFVLAAELVSAKSSPCGRSILF